MDSTHVTLHFHPTGKTVQAPEGSPLRQVIETSGVQLRMPCGGKGRCGKCKVVFQQGAPNPTATEQDVLAETELIQGYRLGCQAVVSNDAVIHIPDSSQAAKILTTGAMRDIPLRPAITKVHARIPEPTTDDLRSDLIRTLDALGIADGDASLPILQRLGSEIRQAGFDITGVLADGRLITIEAGDTSAECFGVALDIGTTTLAAYLLDLTTGKQVSVAAAMNPQALVGDDVISRISYVSQESDGLKKLQASVVEEFNKLLGILSDGAGIPLDRIYEVAVVGNTCMAHLFAGVDPTNLAQAPYVPVFSRSLILEARELGININECGRVHILPHIAGYVGADTIGVILATGLYEDEQLTLAVDIGTNGEIVLGSKGRMLACSTAAGPAFEGAHIKHGMRAVLGAIDSAWIDGGEIHYSAIGEKNAVGICGSGLLDVIICLIQAGIIESSGRIVDADEVPEAYAHLRSRIQEGERGNEFVLATAEEPVVITQRDVREVQLAKGAIQAGIQTLMERLGVRADDLDKVVLAGAFGNYVRKESAIAVGMIPNVPISKVHSVGNAAGEGAKLALISLDARGDSDRIAKSVEYIELTTDPGFQERFADALMFGDDS